MSGLETNPFTLLTLIAAPAILTNASSVMGLGTSNRFARAVDRIRALSSEIQGDQDLRDHIRLMRIRQLHYAQRRSLLLVRALSAFYVSVGSFAGASLVSLLGAGFYVLGHDLLRHVALIVAFCAGLAGVGGLVVGCGLLVFETRLTLRILAEETDNLVSSADAPR
ncbi:MAG TPA: DUF2721 domain-containing protein [Pirellulales bacterium]